MALTAFGFTGTIDNVAWARMAPHLGLPYTVEGLSDFRVESVAGQDRTVRVLVGAADAYGVRVVSDTQITIQLPVIASGSRWDTIVLRRTWAGAGTVSVIALTGTSAAALSTSRVTNPGIQDDQVLARVQVTAGQTLPTAVVDLRGWGGKTLQVPAGADVNAYPTTVGTRLEFPDGTIYVQTAAGLKRRVLQVTSGATDTNDTTIGTGDTAQLAIIPMTAPAPPAGIVLVHLSAQVIAGNSSAGNIWCVTTTGSTHGSQGYQFDGAHNGLMGWTFAVPVTGAGVNIQVMASVESTAVRFARINASSQPIFQGVI